MLRFLQALSEKCRTENGALTHRTTGSECLDLFAAVGALRSATAEEVCTRFLRAYAEDADLAMKILFYARDIRGGLGERAVFRTLLKWLAENERASMVRNLPYVAEFGRWDDLLVLLDTPVRRAVQELLHRRFLADMEALETGETVSLLGKWLPSVNASDPDTVRTARALAKAFGMREAAYRRALTALRARIRIIENALRTRDYTFDYAGQPSGAMLRYRRAFMRCDRARYQAFMREVKEGRAALHTGTLMPYEIVTKAYTAQEDERAALDLTWHALEDFTRDENALVVADGSGSMYWGGEPLPAAVAQSLAIYYAEHNRGIFHGRFITFSRSPRLVEIKGRDITEKVRFCRTFNECANTDLEAVFRLILEAAQAARAPGKDMPSTLYIVSDMEFDACARGASVTNFENARAMYRRCGYTLPRVVFWNVQSRSRQQPVRMNEQGAALVSGCTARIFSQAAQGAADPYTRMMKVIGGERYAMIRAA